MLAFSTAEKLGIVGFFLAILNSLGGLYAWSRLQRVRFKVTIRAGEDGPQHHRQFGIFIDAVNLRADDSIAGVWFKWKLKDNIWHSVPEELWETPARVASRDRFRAVLRTKELKANDLAFPTRAKARIQIVGGKSFRSRTRTLERDH